MPYARAFSTLGCAELDLRACLELATRHGLEGIEVRALAGSLDVPEHLRRSHGSPAALARQLGGDCRRILALDTSLRLTDRGAAEREAFLPFVPWAEELGVPWLRVFDGDFANGGAEVARATLDWWRELRRTNGWQVDLLVETHDSLFRAADIVRFAGTAAGINILWDTHHTWKRSGEDPAATWPAIRPHVAHIHVKDSVGRKGGAPGYTYVEPGQGEFPMAPLVRVLAADYRGAVSLEWERLWHPELGSLDGALAAAKAVAWW